MGRRDGNDGALAFDLALTPFHPSSPPGLCNPSVDVAAAPGGGIAITVSRPKNGAKPAKGRHTTVTKTPSSVRAAHAAGAAAASLGRPDLKRAAAARASALSRAARAGKATAKPAAAAAPVAMEVAEVA